MEEQVGFAPIKVTRRSGDESVPRGGASLGPRMLDFWQWSASDLVSNATRGVFAEYLVAMALSLDGGVRAEWDAFDMVTAAGQKFEVKSAAYLQSWYHKTLSAIKFGIKPTRSWTAAANELASDVRRQADVYVFAVLEHKNKATLDPLDVVQWRFYVLPASYAQ